MWDGLTAVEHLDVVVEQGATLFGFLLTGTGVVVAALPFAFALAPLLLLRLGVDPLACGRIVRGDEHVELSESAGLCK